MSLAYGVMQGGSEEEWRSQEYNGGARALWRLSSLVDRGSGMQGQAEGLGASIASRLAGDRWSTPSGVLLPTVFGEVGRAYAS